jgi:hypothetical protein
VRGWRCRGGQLPLAVGPPTHHHHLALSLRACVRPTCCAAVCISKSKNTQAQVVFKAGYDAAESVNVVAECPCPQPNGLNVTDDANIIRKPQHPYLDREFEYAVRAPRSLSRGARRQRGPLENAMLDSHATHASRMLTHCVCPVPHVAACAPRLAVSDGCHVVRSASGSAVRRPPTKIARTDGPRLFHLRCLALPVPPHAGYCELTCNVSGCLCAWCSELCAASVMQLR